jgi:hypothetical protein
MLGRIAGGLLLHFGLAMNVTWWVLGGFLGSYLGCFLKLVGLWLDF